MADATHIIGRRQFNTQVGRIIPNVLPQIILIDENLNDAAFLAFYSRVAAMNTGQEQFFWDIDRFLALSDTTDGAVSGTTATTIQVDNPTFFIPGQLWSNVRTGEIMYITAVNTSTSVITVDRAVTALNSSGGTAAAAINDADTLIRLGPAVGEVSTRQTTQTTTPAEVSNFAQAMRWELALTRRQIKRKYLTDAELPYQQKKIMKQAQKDMNGIFIAGEKARYTSSDQGDITLTAGINTVITTETFAVGGTLHEYDLDEFLVEQGLRRGSRNKVIFASTQFILAMTQIAKDRLRHDSIAFGPTRGGFGVQVLFYMAPNGAEVMIVEDRFMSENFNGDAFGCDMSVLKRMVFSGNGFNDDLHVISGTQDPDDTGETSTLYADMGLRYGSEDFHFKITGVTGGAIGTSAQ